MLRNARLAGGLTMFFFQFLIQAGLFFTVPLFLSVALGLSAVETGVRLLPLSVTLLPGRRRHPQALAAGVTAAGRALGAGGAARRASSRWSPRSRSGPAPRSSPCRMLLAGLGVGALASQLGAVTVSAVPDEQSGEVGGLQNTATNLGASLGTALAGSVLIAALTASFLQGIQDNPDVPDDVSPLGRGASSPAASRSSPTPTSGRRSRRPGCRRSRRRRSSTRTRRPGSPASG